MTGDTASDRGRILGHPSAALLFGVTIALTLILLGWNYFPSGSAGSLPSSLQVTGEPTRVYVGSDANIRDRATAMGSTIVGRLVSGDLVEGVIEPGENTDYLWLRLSDGSGFVSIVNLSEAAPSGQDSAALSEVVTDSAGMAKGTSTGQGSGPFRDASEYCAAAGTTDGPPDTLYSGPNRVTWIERAVGFEQDYGYVKWGCDKGAVVACVNNGITGPCDKVDTDRTPHDGLLEHCRQNPNSEIPAAASGHYTAFDWVCSNGRPTIRRQFRYPDHRGYNPGDYVYVSRH